MRRLSGKTPRILELTEYLPRRFSREDISDDIGEKLWRDYARYVAVEFPSPATEEKWQITALGYAGYIPLSPDLHLWLQPKVPIRNLWRMWEYAYDSSPDFGKGLHQCESIEEFYESLAIVFAERIIQRERRGLYQTYVTHADNLPYVRGRLEAGTLLRQPSVTTVPCRYRNATTDNEENQILLGALATILKTSCCSKRSRSVVRRAYHALKGRVSLLPVGPEACIGRTYNRLNAGYELLHALSRFFLEGSGPRHEKGPEAMLPFVMNMEQLFERFVARWLQSHLPNQSKLRIQERVPVGRDKDFAFRIDLVISDVQSGDTQIVLDTKYKVRRTLKPENLVAQPSAEDVAQVVAYAEAKQCRDAVLIYPLRIAQPFDAQVGRVRVRSIGFDLNENLEQAGHNFMTTLFAP